MTLKNVNSQSPKENSTPSIANGDSSESLEILYDSGPISDGRTYKEKYNSDKSSSKSDSIIELATTKEVENTVNGDVNSPLSQKNVQCKRNIEVEYGILSPAKL